jgi:proteasome accessory factor B
MQRIERLINLIAALLTTSRPLTAEEIRSRIAGYDQPTIEAFRRTFERDKEALRAMGIPLEVRPSDPFLDQADAYLIPKAAYYLPQLDLEPDELAALKLASEMLLGGTEEAGAAVLKLSLDDPGSPVPGPRIAWGADFAEEGPRLAPLYEAMLARRPVTFSYRPSGGSASVRTVEAYRLLHRHGHWYVVGRDVDKDSLRAFRLSRIASTIETGAGSYEVPASFAASAHLGEAWEVGDEPLGATVRFTAGMRWWAEQNLAERPARPAPGGGLEVDLTVGNADALVSWVIGVAGAVEIVAPPELRARLLDHLAPFLQARAAGG